MVTGFSALAHLLHTVSHNTSTMPSNPLMLMNLYVMLFQLFQNEKKKEDIEKHNYMTKPSNKSKHTLPSFHTEKQEPQSRRTPLQPHNSSSQQGCSMDRRLSDPSTSDNSL